MSDPLKIVQHVPAVLKPLSETELSLLEQAAVLRLAAEACTQANVIAEIAQAMARNRGGAR